MKVLLRSFLSPTGVWGTSYQHSKKKKQNIHKRNKNIHKNKSRGAEEQCATKIYTKTSQQVLKSSAQQKYTQKQVNRCWRAVHNKNTHKNKLKGAEEQCTTKIYTKTSQQVLKSSAQQKYTQKQVNILIAQQKYTQKQVNRWWEAVRNKNIHKNSQ